VGESFVNPFRPGAGHTPPYLAGRETEKHEFQRLLAQDVILDNVVLTGLRGIGKTVLMEELRPLAQAAGWLWVGSDLSESTSVSEEKLALRLITDLAVVTTSLVVARRSKPVVGFGGRTTTVPVCLDYDALIGVFSKTPGLVQDKLRTVLELVWEALQRLPAPPKGVVFAYDEAQNLSDQAGRDEFPLSLLLDVFQSIQRRDVRFMLLLTGLPTLFPRLVDARTFAERMFRVLFLKRLDRVHSREAIVRPIDNVGCPFKLTRHSIEAIIDESGGYPYFIQFICREVYDQFVGSHRQSGQPSPVLMAAITRKLDSDFFAGRWARITDRQRDLLFVIASLDHGDDEFTVQEVVEGARTSQKKPFSPSHVNQMLATLTTSGLVYKNRHGKYSFAVPMFGKFVLRQLEPDAVDA
jgi:hypothetical protein